MSVQINDWEDGTCEGRFYSVDEAKAYVLENEMDVILYYIETAKSLFKAGIRKVK